jgi:ABC-type branched-subunit amino acid transport system substrate-binding protein
MAFVAEDKVFDAQEIRVNTEVISTIAVSAGLTVKTVFVCNDHNQQGTFTVWGSPLADHSKEAQIGNSFNIAANTVDFESFDTYFPYVRVKVTYSTAPTTGNLSVFLEKVGA